MDNFDLSRARLSKKDDFQRFDVSDTMPLAKAIKEHKIALEDTVLIMERGNKTLAFSAFQMAYHHVAQGVLANQPYLVAF